MYYKVLCNLWDVWWLVKVLSYLNPQQDVWVHLSAHYFHIESFCYIVVTLLRRKAHARLYVIWSHRSKLTSLWTIKIDSMLYSLLSLIYYLQSNTYIMYRNLNSGLKPSTTYVLVPHKCMLMTCSVLTWLDKVKSICYFTWVLIRVEMF